MLIKVEGPKLTKLFWALVIWKSGGAQSYFYHSLSQKLGGPGPPRPIVRLRPCWWCIKMPRFICNHDLGKEMGNRGSKSLLGRCPSSHMPYRSPSVTWISTTIEQSNICKCVMLQGYSKKGSSFRKIEQENVRTNKFNNWCFWSVHRAADTVSFVPKT